MLKLSLLMNVAKTKKLKNCNKQNNKITGSRNLDKKNLVDKFIIYR